MLTPAVAFATAALLAFLPGEDPQSSARAPANCVKLAVADTGVMSDANDACVFAIVEAAKEPGCSKSKGRAMSAADRRLRAIPAVHHLEEHAALSWPVDFIALTADAATAVWDSTIGFIGDLYDFAEREASGLSI